MPAHPSRKYKSAARVGHPDDVAARFRDAQALLRRDAEDDLAQQGAQISRALEGDVFR
jgi:hypothetical protein